LRVKTDMREPAATGGRSAAIRFERRFMLLILLAWSIPPIFGLSFLIFIGMFSAAQMAVILATPLQPLFVVGTLAFALGYFRIYIRPLRGYLEDPGSVNAGVLLRRVRRFPLDFWATFLGYLLLAPASVIVSAERYAGYLPQAGDWLRIHLVALIVSIIVGLPIFFLILDLNLPQKCRHLPLTTGGVYGKTQGATKDRSVLQ